MDLKYMPVETPIAPRTTLVTPVQVAAAMIAVAADRGDLYVDESSMLRDLDGRGCIQGAMLDKLGIEHVPSGSTPDVMHFLGYSSHSWRDSRELRLAEALSAAEYANDSRLPWSAALEAFERVMAGESVHELRTLIGSAREAQRYLKDSACLLAKAKAKWAPSWAHTHFTQLYEAEVASAKQLNELLKSSTAWIDEPIGETFASVGV